MDQQTTFLHIELNSAKNRKVTYNFTYMLANESIISLQGVSMGLVTDGLIRN